MHHYNVHSEKPFECTQCGEKGNGVVKFKNHMRKHSTQKKVNKCEVCQSSVWNPTSWKSQRAYMSLHTFVKVVKAQKSKSPKTCEPCGKTFARKDVFDKHVKVHIWKIVTNKFTRKDKLVQHVNRVHTDTVQSDFGFGAFQKQKKVKKGRTFMCEKCAKTFTSEANIKRHFLTAAHINRQKTKASRWKVMRHVKRLLKNPQYADELKKRSTKGPVK